MATTGIARAPGYVDYSSTGTGGQFTPEIWSMLLTLKVFAATIFNEICDLSWEGEIQKMGDTVHIRVPPDININPYEIGQDIQYQSPSSTPTSLTIDQGLYWAYAIDNIDRYEADIELMDMFTQVAVQQTMVRQDQILLAAMPAQAGTANSGNAAGALSGNVDLGTLALPLSVNAANIVDSIILAANQCLDEQNIPHDGRRWIALPSWAIRLMLNSELKFAYETGDAVSPLRNGLTGEVAGLKIYQSNNLSTDTVDYVKTWNIPFGWSPGLAWASQFTETDIVKLIDKIGTGVRSVCAYGFNTVVPDYLGNIVAKQLIA